MYMYNVFQGWHSVSEPIHLPHDFGETLLDKFCPFIARMTAVMKYNKHFSFKCMQSDFGEDYITWLEEVGWKSIFWQLWTIKIQLQIHFLNMNKVVNLVLSNLQSS